MCQSSSDLKRIDICHSASCSASQKCSEPDRSQQSGQRIWSPADRRSRRAATTGCTCSRISARHTQHVNVAPLRCNTIARESMQFRWFHREPKDASEMLHAARSRPQLVQLDLTICTLHMSSDTHGLGAGETTVGRQVGAAAAAGCGGARLRRRRLVCLEKDRWTNHQIVCLQTI